MHKTQTSTSKDWLDFSKMVKADMYVERCLTEEKSKRANEDQCGQSTSSMRRDE